jgi:hypothetical protein
MYVKFPRATVFVGDTLAKQAPPSKPSRSSQIPPPQCITLWASRPLSVPQGRAVAVRKTGSSVDLGLVPVGNTSVAWLPADQILSQAQIARWLATSSFRRM